MERLFSPCTRLRDLAENRGQIEGYTDRDAVESLQELDLDVSTEEFLSSEKVFIYEDFNAMLENRKTVAWLTPHAAVTHVGGPGAYFFGRNGCVMELLFQCRQ
jgi:hypothetical protein